MDGQSSRHFSLFYHVITTDLSDCEAVMLQYYGKKCIVANVFGGWQADIFIFVMWLPQTGTLVVWKADGRGRPGQPVGQQKLDEPLTQIVLIPPPAVDPA